ncbi:MAG: protein-tyrosine-phosphatase [Chitinophagales bacterium]
MKQILHNNIPFIKMFLPLQSYIQSVTNDFQNIPTIRQKILESVGTFIRQQLNNNQRINLNFICTHNSRRSHFGQVWAEIAVIHYGLKNIHTYSGGTEATSFNIRSVAALQRAGFEVKKLEQDNESENPRYQLYFADDTPPMTCFSKAYDHFANPSINFIAIMTCSDADENCPLVLGAIQRFSVTYEDPKVADDTPKETLKYDERCRQIATETFYMLSKV